MAELRIQEIVKQKKRTMAWLAKQAGYRQPSSFYAAMKRGLDIPRLERIAAALDVEVPDLFERSKVTITCPHCGETIELTVEGIK